MNKNLTDNELLEYLENEESREFEGWDFSYLESTGRTREFPLRWNYWNVVKEKMDGVTSLLDMGTGGGEFFSSLVPLPAYTCATEGYKPNLAVAKKRLVKKYFEKLKEINYLIQREGYIDFTCHRFLIIAAKE